MKKIYLSLFTFLLLLCQLSGDEKKSFRNEVIKMDKNGDRKISKQEAKGKLLDLFDKIDTNSDGMLVPKELLSYFRKSKSPNSSQSSKAKPAKAPEGGQKRIYKKVDGVDLPLYIFSPSNHNSSDQAPTIVFFFGGGWNAGSPTQFEAHCKDLAKEGMVAITVEYRVKSRHGCKIEDCIEDAKSAMRWVRGHADELGIDPNRIASAGGSAGGHLGACVYLIDDFNAKTDDLSVSHKSNAMVLFNPAMAIAPHPAFSEDINLLIKQSQKDHSHGPIEKVSPLQYSHLKQPPCIMFFGTADMLLKGAEKYVELSTKSGNDCSLITYEGQNHGFFNGKKGHKYYDLTYSEMVSFFKKLGWIGTSSLAK